MSRNITCIKYGENQAGLDFPPLPGELGQRIFNSVSQKAWSDWINQQTMIINENRLNLADESSRKYLKQQLEHYFFQSKEG